MKNAPYQGGEQGMGDSPSQKTFLRLSREPTYVSWTLVTRKYAPRSRSLNLSTFPLAGF